MCVPWTPSSLALKEHALIPLSESSDRMQQNALSQTTRGVHPGPPFNHVDPFTWPSWSIGTAVQEPNGPATMKTPYMGPLLLLAHPPWPTTPPNPNPQPKTPQPHSPHQAKPIEGVDHQHAAGTLAQAKAAQHLRAIQRHLLWFPSKANPPKSGSPGSRAHSLNTTTDGATQPPLVNSFV